MFFEKEYVSVGTVSASATTPVSSALSGPGATHPARIEADTRPTRDRHAREKERVFMWMASVNGMDQGSDRRRAAEPTSRTQVRGTRRRPRAAGGPPGWCPPRSTRQTHAAEGVKKNRERSSR